MMVNSDFQQLWDTLKEASTKVFNLMGNTIMMIRVNTLEYCSFVCVLGKIQAPVPKRYRNYSSGCGEETSRDTWRKGKESKIEILLFFLQIAVLCGINSQANGNIVRMMA